MKRTTMLQGREDASHRLQHAAKKRLVALAVILGGVTSAHGQSIDISPFIGGRFGGSFNLEQAGQPNFRANLRDSLSFGISGGFRFDQEDCANCGLIEFRWMRQNSRLTVKQDPLALTPTPLGAAAFSAPVTLDNYLGDFTREWPLESAKSVRPFITGTLGVVHISAPAAGATRFTFGLGGGFKAFPSQHWGFKLQAEYLPIVLHSAVQPVVCVASCVAILTGGLANQFTVSVGPVFRFR
jgi:hypothetical protein